MAALCWTLVAVAVALYWYRGHRAQRRGSATPFATAASTASASSAPGQDSGDSEALRAARLARFEAEHAAAAERAAERQRVRRSPART